MAAKPRARSTKIRSNIPAAHLSLISQFEIQVADSVAVHQLPAYCISHLNRHATLTGWPFNIPAGGENDGYKDKSRRA
jgi:hypothetical protein